MVLERMLVVVGVTAVIAGVFPSAPDACALPTSDHQCCSQPPAGHVDSCCEPSIPHESMSDIGCGCDHQQHTAPLATFASPSHDVNDGAALAAAPVRVAATDAVGNRPGRHTETFRAHPPPPLFLLDCTFLT